ncbi:PCBP3, partial [Symbiodinium necroappetens]
SWRPRRGEPKAAAYGQRCQHTAAQRALVACCVPGERRVSRCFLGGRRRSAAASALRRSGEGLRDTAGGRGRPTCGACSDSCAGGDDPRSGVSAPHRCAGGSHQAPARGVGLRDPSLSRECCRHCRPAACEMQRVGCQPRRGRGARARGAGGICGDWDPLAEAFRSPRGYSGRAGGPGCERFAPPFGRRPCWHRAPRGTQCSGCRAAAGGGRGVRLADRQARE